MVECQYCGRMRKPDDTLCKSCGAPYQRPQTKAPEGGYWKHPVVYILTA